MRAKFIYTAKDDFKAMVMKLFCRKNHAVVYKQKLYRKVEKRLEAKFDIVKIFEKL